MKKNIVKIALKNTLGYLILLILLSISISYLTLLIALNVKYAIDYVLLNQYSEIPQILNKVFTHNYRQDLTIVAIVIIGLNLVQKLLNYFRNRVTTKFKLKININLKSALYRHVLNLEYDSYNSFDKTEMMQRINEDADVYSDFFNNQFNVILDIIFLSIFIIREGIILNFTISLYILITIVIMLIFSLWYYKKLGICLENMILKRKELLKSTIDNINNFRFIRMFNKQENEKNNYKILNNDCCNQEVKFIKFVLFYDIILEHLSYLKSPIIYMLGGIAVINRKNDNGFSNGVTHSSWKSFRLYLYFWGRFECN